MNTFVFYWNIKTLNLFGVFFVFSFQTFQQDLGCQQPITSSVLSRGQLLLRCINSMSPCQSPAWSQIHRFIRVIIYHLFFLSIFQSLLCSSERHSAADWAAIRTSAAFPPVHAGPTQPAGGSGPAGCLVAPPVVADGTTTCPKIRLISWIFFFFFYQSWYCLCGNAREVTESTASCASSVLHADWPSITKPPTDQWSKWHCSYILCCGAINHFEKIYQIKFMPITNLAFFKTLQAGHKCVLFLMFELSKPSLILRLFFLYTAFFFFFFTRTWNEVVTSGQQVHLSPAGSVCYSSGKCVTQW